MDNFHFFRKILLIVLLFAGLFSGELVAQQQFTLTEFNPQQTQLGVYHSYQFKTLLISLVQKPSDQFNCRPNTYFIYQYGKGRLLELHAGDLRVDRDFNRAMYTKIHTLGILSKQNQRDWKKRAAQIMLALEVPAQTMDAGKSENKQQTLSCWQQPVLTELNGYKLRTYPFLVSNLCQQRWCSDFFWSDAQHVKLWIQVEPKKLHKVSLNTQSGSIKYQTSSAPFKRDKYQQTNAPRDNLVTPDKLNGSSVLLPGKQGNIVFSWKKNKNQQITLSFMRNPAAKLEAQESNQQIESYLQEREYTKALSAIRFALWQDPQHEGVRFNRLKLFALMHQPQKLFTALKDDFSPAERTKACQRIHLEPTFKNLWKRQNFLNQFQQTCS